MIAPALQGQTVVVLGGSAGIGFATARRARSEGAEVVLVGRNRERLEQAAGEVGASSTAAFDATDAEALQGFFAGLPAAVHHVMVTAGRPHYAPRLVAMDPDEARDGLDDHLLQVIAVARAVDGKLRASGSLVCMGASDTRPGLGAGAATTQGAALSRLIANLALELAPARINLVAAGFVDTPLSADLLGDRLDARRAELRDTLPIGRVVQPDDVAALAVHLMINTAVTGATYAIDGGQQYL